MVQMQSGDFTYSVPLLEVPGPAGSYPISLFYHAGIKTGQEASWTGLGWNLNVGEINRDVNGTPDDTWLDRNLFPTSSLQADDVPLNPYTETHVYWSGGETTTENYGFSFGYGIGPAQIGANAGIEISHDTYKGQNINGSFGPSMGISTGAVNVGIGVSYSTAGSITVSMNAGVGAGGLSLGGHMSVTYGFDGRSGGSIGLGLYTSYGEALGYSMAADGSSGGWNVGGFSSSTGSSKSGKISTSSHSSGFSIPIFWYCGLQIAFSFGKSYTRYWLDDRTYSTTWGALYASDYGQCATDYAISATPSSSWSWAANDYDFYSMLDAVYHKPTDALNNSDPTYQLGGSLPDFDAYSVTGQGLAGAIEPYIFENISMTRSSGDIRKTGWVVSNNYDNPTCTTKPHTQFNTTSNTVNFRFKGDVSNNNYWTNTTGSPYPTIDANNLPAFNSPNSIHGACSGTNSAPGAVPGSKYIRWYTNDMRGSQLYLDYDGPTELPEHTLNGVNISKQIGCIAITNPNGVTYYYSLPVYEYSEYEKTTVISKNLGEQYTEIRKGAPYAYTWLLTAITGPDFVDKGGSSNGPNGKLDDNDLGYWVKFKYDKWADDYKWRSPGEGQSVDIDGLRENYSSGHKEIYYLSSVETQSHIALFYKDVRTDGKSSVKDGFNPCGSSQDNELQSEQALATNGIELPVASLKLAKILLLKKSDLYQIDNESTLRSHSAPYSTGYMTGATYNGNTSSPIYTKLHNGENVLDIHDYDTYQSQLFSKCLRAVDFNYDGVNPLCPETPNSYDNNTIYQVFSDLDTWFDYWRYPQSHPRTIPQAKLTLKSIDILGRGAQKVTPSILFDYELSNPRSGTCSLTAINPGEKTGTLLISGSSQLPGDILKVNNGTGGFYYMFLKAVTGANEFAVSFVSSINVPTSTFSGYSFTETKNPPYNKDLYDQWGYYKPDLEVAAYNQDADRRTSDVSAKAVDVWSLRQVTTPIGAKIRIKYESDNYGVPAFSNKIMLAVRPHDIQMSNNTITVPLASNIDPNSLFSVGDKISLCLELIDVGYTGNGDTWETAAAQGNNNCTSDKYLHFRTKSDNNCTITSIGSNSITVSSSALYSSLTSGVADDSHYLLVSQPTHSENLTFHYTPPFIQSGFIISDKKDVKLWGGGLRVKELAMLDNNDVVQGSSIYTYENDGESNGRTTYEPASMTPVQYDTYWIDHFFTNNAVGDGLGAYFEGASKSGEADFRKAIYSNLSELVYYSRLIPPPDVLYKQVDVSSLGTNGSSAPGFTRYKFQTFERSMIEVIGGDHDFITPQNANAVYKVGKRKFRDKTASLGALLSTEIYNSTGQLEKSSSNAYKDYRDIQIGYNDLKTSDLVMNGVGIIQEAFNETRVKNFSNGINNAGGNCNLNLSDFLVNSDTIFIVQTIKEEYPSFLSQTSEFHDGISNTIYYSKYDAMNGRPTETISENSFGEFYKSISVPAYTIYPQMGSMNTSGNKNMLTQEAASYTYFSTSKNGTYYPVSATIQTWNKDWSYRYLDNSIGAFVYSGGYLYPCCPDGSGIWRKHQSWSWKGEVNADGTYAGFTDFDWTDPSTTFGYTGSTHTNQAHGWQKNSEVTLYDNFSRALEEKDINENFATAKIGYDNGMVIGNATNSSYTGFATSSFEDPIAGTNWFGGEVAGASAYLAASSSNKAHSGTGMIVGGSVTTIYSATLDKETSPRKYSASIWIKGGTGILTLSSGSSSVTATAVSGINNAGWQLYTATITTNGGTSNAIQATVSGTGAYFDDFRIHPTDASVSSYVYDPLTAQVTYILGNDNLYSRFEYDNNGRIVATYKETPVGEKIVSRNHYNYARGL